MLVQCNEIPFLFVSQVESREFHYNPSTGGGVVFTFSSLWVDIQISIGNVAEQASSRSQEEGIDYSLKLG